MLVNGIDVDIQKIKSKSKNKNEAIRKVRELTGATLKDAINAVENNVESGKNEKYFECKEKRTEENKSSFYDEMKKLPGFDYSMQSILGTKKEVKHLKKLLKEDEEVLAIASGFMDGNTWLIACTSRRIIFVDCGMIYGVKHSEVMIEKVNAVSFKNGLMFGEIHIEDGASTRIIRNVEKCSTKPFVDAVHNAMDLSKKENSVVTQNTSSNADELLKFKQLLDMGAIAQDEFEQQKRKLLGT